MAQLRLELLLLSGRGLLLTAPSSGAVTVGQVRRAAEKRLQLGIAKLIHQDQILSDSSSLEEAGLKDGDVIVASVGHPEILGCRQCPCFFLVRGDGRVAIWGDGSLGVPRHLKKPQQVVGCKGALAALVEGGSVLTWGSGFTPSEELLGKLQDVCQICATEDAFSALCRDGQLVTWAPSRSGGASGGGAGGAAVEELLGAVGMVAASSKAFLAIARDGLHCASFTAGAEASQLPKRLAPLRGAARQVAATAERFAVLQEDGKVVQWQRNSRAVVLLEEVAELCASEDAFVALRKDGTVLSWGRTRATPQVLEVAGLGLGLTQVVASRFAFAGLRRDGTVKVWGHERFGGDPKAVRKLTDVCRLHGSSAAFCALRRDGSVAAWGDARCGGDATALAAQLRDVRRLCRFKRRFFETEE